MPITSPIETNNVVDRRKGQLTVLLAMVEADIQRTSETESFMVRAGLLRDIILENQSLSDRIDVLEGALRQIQTGSDRGIAQFNERQAGRRSPIWRSVNVLQDNLAACYGTALAALIKVDPHASLTQGGKTNG